jgi:hypothetical protein
VEARLGHLKESRKMRFTRAAYARVMAKKVKSPRKTARPTHEVAWIITRLTGTPARYVGRVLAANEADAIKRAIEEFKIRNPEMQKRLAARREK